MGNSKAVISFRKRRKENLIKVSGGKCCLCGYNKSLSALEFHHINPENKLYAISSSGNCHDLNKDLLEVKKCILVCANCHREIHDGLYTQEELWNKQIYDENMVTQLQKDLLGFKSKTIYYCKECGKEIFQVGTTHLCEECYKKTLRVVNRPSREELKKLIRIKSFTQIAEQYKVSDNAIRKWCKAENLPFRKREINLLNDDDWSKI